MSKLKLKVCGMRNPENIHQLAKLQPDFMGFIFYGKSPRFVSEPDENLFFLPFRQLPEQEYEDEDHN